MNEDSSFILEDCDHTFVLSNFSNNDNIFLITKLKLKFLKVYKKKYTLAGKDFHTN